MTGWRQPHTANEVKETEALEVLRSLGWQITQDSRLRGGPVPPLARGP